MLTWLRWPRRSGLEDGAAARPGRNLKGEEPVKRSVRRYLDIGRNLALDLRYGGFLGRPEESRFSHLGVYGVVHTDVRVLAAIFRDAIGREDVLVDVGCGKGRVLHYWLSCGLKNKMIGLEFDPEIATRAQERLKRFPNVTIVAGNAVDTLPTDGTLFYLFNPLSADALADFKRALRERCPRVTLLYYNSEHIGVFLNDPEWFVKEVDLTLRLPRSYTASSVVHPFAVIRSRGDHVG
jgi:SAM-dependent methyltransferase